MLDAKPLNVYCRPKRGLMQKNLSRLTIACL